MKKELKFEDMSMNDFIRMAKKNGYEVQLNEDKKLAIECLREVKESILPRPEYRYETLKRIDVVNIIDTKIKELEGKEK